MVAYVLVHGSGQNAASWTPIAERLRALGHDVVTPELPKHEPKWGYREHADRIARATPEGAIVVAHSLCGVFLPLVATLRPCRQLVFVAAVIPEVGRSVREQFAADPTMFAPAWIAAGARWHEPGQARALGAEFLFHDCAEPMRTLAGDTIEPLDSRRIVQERSPVAVPPGLPTACIVATEDRTLAPAWITAASRRVLGVEPILVRAGHCPHQSQPAEMTQLLAALARTG